MDRRRLLLLAIATGVVVLDQLTKWWALERLDGGETIDVVWTLRFALAFNTGTAFSLGSGSGLGAWLAVGAIVVVSIFLWRSTFTSTRWGAIAAGLIVGGALGNIVDRAARGDGGVFSGAVVDFVDLQWWPVFNLADAAIVCGAILLVVGLVFWSDEDAGDDRRGAAGGADEDPDVRLADKATS